MKLAIAEKFSWKIFLYLLQTKIQNIKIDN